MLRMCRVRLYPTNAQRDVLAKHFGCVRWVYNWGLETCQTAYKETGRKPTYYDLQNRLPALKAYHEWLKDGVAQSMQVALQNLTVAFDRFFSKQSAYPKFKRKDARQSATYPIRAYIAERRPNGWGKVRLPKIGLVRARIHRPFTAKNTSATVVLDTAGRYWASFVVELPDPVPQPRAQEVLGVDLGITHFAVLSTGDKIANERFLRQAARNLRCKKKALTRKREGSANREKARQRVASAYKRLLDARGDFLHKLSRRLVNENQAIAVETLNVRGMMSNRSCAKAIGDCGWYSFAEMLRYKAEQEGKPFIKVDRFFPSSKQCSACGIKTDLTLDQRQWRCQSCGTSHDRDINAARNISAEGARLLAEGYPAAASGRAVSRWKPSSLARARKKEETREGSIHLVLADPNPAPLAS